MKNKYVLIICRNCGNITGFTEEYYNNKIKGNRKHKNTCTKCGNGRVIDSMKEITDNLKEIFSVEGLTKFKADDKFHYYEERIRKSVDKGFEILKVESDKD